ncbi:hypothetical protein PR003_g24855 [Phytophthora rubi]|uniref:Uncharacterized protein n=1 Tax=Phytophthora rubi TaxID=129364 RepID=A0A6A4CKF7_9STRA|nr:hypothetical protein PR003_g24855 [Phytophthora rubi]
MHRKVTRTTAQNGPTAGVAASSELCAQRHNTKVNSTEASQEEQAQHHLWRCWQLDTHGEYGVEHDGRLAAASGDRIHCAAPHKRDLGRDESRQDRLGTEWAVESKDRTAESWARVSKEVSTYLLLVLRGLEFLVEEEICSKLQVESVEICSVQENPRPPYMQVMQGQAAVGKLILRTKSSAAEVQELRSVQATLALLAKSDEIDTESDAGVKQIRHILTLHRHRIPPIRLEMMLFLKVNRCFWGATATVSKAA